MTLSEYPDGPLRILRTLKRMLHEERPWKPVSGGWHRHGRESFCKAQVLSAVGCGERIRVHPEFAWNNPKPKVVLAVSSQRKIIGAALGSDVNLLDVEGGSTLLLSKAKDNNASCAIGPFIRSFGNKFTLDDVRRAGVTLKFTGRDSLELDGFLSMSQRPVTATWCNNCYQGWAGKAVIIQPDLNYMLELTVALDLGHLMVHRPKTGVFALEPRSQFFRPDHGRCIWPSGACNRGADGSVAGFRAVRSAARSGYDRKRNASHVILHDLILPKMSLCPAGGSFSGG